MSKSPDLLAHIEDLTNNPKATCILGIEVFCADGIGAVGGDLDKDRVLRIDDFEVEEKFRRQGIGKKLLQAISRIGTEHGVTTISAGLTTKESFLTFSSVFGFSNLNLVDKQKRVVNIPFKEIVKSYYHAERYYAKLGRPTEFWYELLVDASEIDISQWPNARLINQDQYTYFKNLPQTQI